MSWENLKQLVKDSDANLYVVYDADLASECPVYGVFTSLDRAEEAIEQLVAKEVDAILAAPAKETGVTEDDREWLLKDTKRSFAIQILEQGINALM